MLFQQMTFLSLGWDTEERLYVQGKRQASPISEKNLRSLGRLWINLNFPEETDTTNMKIITESQNHRITELQNHRMLGVARDLCGLSSPTPPAKAGTPRAGCRGPCPDGSWISPEKETPQPAWAACASAPSPSEGRSSSSCTIKAF